MSNEPLYPCAGICLPDADEAYCIGCGRPWGEPRPMPQPAETPEPVKKDDDSPA